jgi:large subunit ribosomal protein L3
MIDDDSKKVTPDSGFLGYGLLRGKYILVEGSVPGPNKRLIRLRKAARTTKHSPTEIKFLSLKSKQGV